MWSLYQEEIKRLVFYPFIGMFLAFVLYAVEFSQTKTIDIKDPHFIGKIASLVVFGKMMMKYLMFEVIALRDGGGWAYLTDFWNLIDWAILTLTVCFVATEFSPFLSISTRNIVGGLAVMAMYIKIFRFLRIFSVFTTFIRMVQDMISDAKVFLLMLIIVISGFAITMLVFNLNREEDITIFDS
jgi:hypothetical protein